MASLAGVSAGWRISAGQLQLINGNSHGQNQWRLAGEYQLSIIIAGVMWRLSC